MPRPGERPRVLAGVADLYVAELITELELALECDILTVVGQDRRGVFFLPRTGSERAVLQFLSSVDYFRALQSLSEAGK